MAHHPHPSDVRYGPGAIEQLPGLVQDLGSQRALLVCGSTSFEASGAARVLPALEDAVELVRWSDFSPNTDIEDLMKGLDVLQAHAPQVVVGVGGGSAMDMAKLLCAFETVERADLEAAVTSAGAIEHRSPRLILAPTTSGSGSEATHFAVVYVGEEKYSIAGPGLYADHVLLDPELGRSGSAYQRATSGIDAICQAIESFWAVNATPVSRGYARHALALLLRNFEPFVHHPSGATARAMSIGSHLAGRAIDISKTTAAHALAYGITKRYGVSHGNAVALTLPAFVALHDRPDEDRLQPGVDPLAHQRSLVLIASMLGTASAVEAAEALRTLLKRVGLIPTLTDAGFRGEQDAQMLIDSVNIERLRNNPMRLSEEDLRTVILDSA